jgi:hypothetical protein
MMTDPSADATDDEMAIIDALATKIVAVLGEVNHRIAIGALQAALSNEIINIESWTGT